MNPLIQLRSAWISDPAVQRIPHDDDEIVSGDSRQSARLRPTTELTKAAALVLQGAGFAHPLGDGSYLVAWTDWSASR